MRKSSLTFVVVAVSLAGAGAVLAQQPMAGDYQLQQPMAGSYALEQPMAGSYQLQQPLAGQEVPQQPYVRGHYPRWPYAGGYAYSPWQPSLGADNLQLWQLDEAEADDQAP